MDLDRQSAAASLADIDTAEQRTFKAVFYGRSGATLILWGVLVAAGYVVTQFVPEHAPLIWLSIWAGGFIGMAALRRYGKSLLTAPHRSLLSRLIFAQLALIVFAHLILWLLGPVNARQMNAFWPLIFMLGYVLAGIWIGPFFIGCGIAVTALTFIGYFFSGEYFPLWMAAANGGAMILGGLWLRRAGVHA